MHSQNLKMANLTIRLHRDTASGAGASFQATVIESPFPRMGGAATMPWSQNELQSLRAWAERAIGRAQQTPEHRERLPEAEVVSARGRQLYAALPVEIQTAVVRCRNWAQRHRRVLQFGFELDDETARPSDDPMGVRLADLPWEWLCLPDGAHLGLAPDTPLVRIVARLSEHRPPPPAAFRHILLVESAAPREGVRPDLHKVGTGLMAGLPEATVDACPARLAALQEALMARPYEMICFLGHGDFEWASEQGRLFFEDDEGRSLPMNAAQIAAMLAGVPASPIVLLLACQSGRRIADQLVREGAAAAVVAMQFDISSDAAGVFVRGLTTSLASGSPVAVATADGRRAVRAAGFAFEWGTPACYLPRAAGDALTWTERLEEAVYTVMAAMADLFTAAGMIRLLKAALLLLLQRGLWLPWVELPGGPIVPAALALLTGSVIVPMLLTLLSRPPRRDALLAHLSPEGQRIARRFQLTGAYLGYWIGLAVDLIMLAVPLYYARLGQLCPSILRPLLWWLAAIPPLAFGYTGLRRVARSVTAAFCQPRWTTNDWLILLGMPLAVAPGVAWTLAQASHLWLDRRLAPWLLGTAVTVTALLAAWQRRRGKKRPE